MQLITESLSRATIVTLQGENLDASNAQKFKEEIAPILAANSMVLLNLGTLNFVDSSGLGALLSCLRTMNNHNGQLKLYAMTKPVQALFELVRMNRIFSIYQDREEALASFE